MGKIIEKLKAAIIKANSLAVAKLVWDSKTTAKITRERTEHDYQITPIVYKIEVLKKGKWVGDVKWNPDIALEDESALDGPLEVTDLILRDQIVNGYLNEQEQWLENPHTGMSALGRGVGGSEGKYVAKLEGVTPDQHNKAKAIAGGKILLARDISDIRVECIEQDSQTFRFETDGPDGESISIDASGELSSKRHALGAVALLEDREELVGALRKVLVKAEDQARKKMVEPRKSKLRR